jgi:acyl-CoA-binding protein
VKDSFVVQSFATKQPKSKKDKKDKKMSSDREFHVVAEKIKSNFSATWAPQLQAKLYGLYKQSIKGDNDTDKPATPWFPTPSYYADCAKWDGWEAQRGKSVQQARQEYVQLGNQVLKAITAKQPLPQG